MCCYIVGKAEYRMATIPEHNNKLFVNILRVMCPMQYIVQCTMYILII